MDYKLGRVPDSTVNSSTLMNDSLGNFSLSPAFGDLDEQSMCFGVREDQFFPEFAMPVDPNRKTDFATVGSDGTNTLQPNWDPRAMLTDLSFLEKEIHKVQDAVRSIIGQDGQLVVRPDELAAQKRLVTADLASIIVHLISTTSNLLPSAQSSLLSDNPSLRQLENMVNSSGNRQANEVTTERIPPPDQGKMLNNSQVDMSDHAVSDDHDAKDFEEGEYENLLPGSYEVLQLEKEEILAPHTHFCQICGKGFKRDANLRMHMRGHGDEYKTPAALAKPGKESNSMHTLIKRYSCPVIGCKRNKDHKKFQPLKTILCVKNHYKRSHCDKSYTCSRCHSKKFSVIADLKTHEKHCGRDKWLCSCGTSFSRKDKLFGHVALFQGHTPALPSDETKMAYTSDQVQACGGDAGFDCGGTSSGDVDLLDIKGLDDDPTLMSSMSYNMSNFGGFLEFPRPTFEASDVSFPFLPSLAGNFPRKNGMYPTPNLPEA